MENLNERYGYHAVMLDERHPRRRQFTIEPPLRSFLRSSDQNKGPLRNVTWGTRQYRNNNSEHFTCADHNFFLLFGSSYRVTTTLWIIETRPSTHYPIPLRCTQSPPLSASCGVRGRGFDCRRRQHCRSSTSRRRVNEQAQKLCILSRRDCFFGAICSKLAPGGLRGELTVRERRAAQNKHSAAYEGL